MARMATGFRALALAWACAGSALAHTDVVLDSTKAPHGGQMRVAGTYHLELVVARGGSETTERALVVYVTDHDGKALPTAGGIGTATLLAGKVRANVTLAPDGDNRLKGLARVPATADLKAVVTVTLPGRAVEQARFTPLESLPAKGSR